MKLIHKQIAAAVIASLSVGAASATFIPAELVGTKNGSNVQETLDGLAARNAQQDADIHNTYVLANTKYTESAGKALEATVASNKADQAKRDAGQDAAIKAANDIGTAGYEIAQGVSGQVANVSQTLTATRNDLKQTKADQAVRDAGQDAAIKAANDIGTAGYEIAQGVSGQVANVSQTLTATRNDLKQTKADQAVRDAGQDEHINAVQGAAQTANDRASALETRADVTEENVRNVQGAAQTANDRASALETRADAGEAHNAAQDKTLKSHDARISANTTAIDTVRGDFVQQAAVTDQRFFDTQQRINENKAAQAKVNQQMAGRLDNHESRISNLESTTNSRFANIDKRINDVKDRADAGVAGVAAMANIPQVLESQQFSLGAGVGARNSQQALAVGFSARASQSVVIKASVAADTDSGFTVGAGASVGW